MCFSAEASFLSSIVIGTLTGIAFIVNAWTRHPRQHYWWPMLMTPAFFTAQQYAEGRLWQILSTSNDPCLHNYFYLPIFLVIAVAGLIYWFPLWVPLSSWILEFGYQPAKKNARFWIQTVLLLIAIPFTGYFFYLFAHYWQSERFPCAHVVHKHIVYEWNFNVEWETLTYYTTPRRLITYAGSRFFLCLCRCPLSGGALLLRLFAFYVFLYFSFLLFVFFPRYVFCLALSLLMIVVLCVLPHALSSSRMLNLMSFVSFFSAAITKVAYDYAFHSVWCFFAALMSLIFIMAVFVDIYQWKTSQKLTEKTHKTL